MNSKNLKKFSFLIFFFIFSSWVSAEEAFDMAGDAPTPVWPSKHGISAHRGKLDTTGPLQGKKRLILDLPDGSTVELERDRYKKRRKQDSAVWVGHVVGEQDSRAMLTINKGILMGRLRIIEKVYEIRVDNNSNNIDNDSAKKGNQGKKNFTYIVEELNLESFPEGDDAVYLPELDHDNDGTASPTNSDYPVTTANDGVVIIDLMSLYTPTARNAAGGVGNIEATIQAAVDAANTAFTDSGMNMQYRLVHMEESSYDESSGTSISTDLNWVTTNSGVNALRNQYGADMVSLIIENGGGSCGIGYVQRSPSLSFAPYAFQVTDRGCAVGNLTFAHEHGHNLGFEHNPENSSVSGSGASYNWSFGHYVYGSFRTVMSYSGVCGNCTRVARFSNPDKKYYYDPNNPSLFDYTGIANQRDNAQTGDLVASLVASFRSTQVPLSNSLPSFNTDPIDLGDLEVDNAISGNLSGYASDADNDPLTFSITSGPSWLNISNSGELSGTPLSNNVGSNEFIVKVDDGNGGTDSAVVQVNVTSPLPSVPPASELTLKVAVDNSNEVYVNGVLVGSGNNWQVAGVYQVALQEGENVVAIKGVDAGGIAALLAELSWDNNVAVSDSGWKVSTQEQTGWNNTGFNDSNWQTATSYGVYGVSPWKLRISGINSNSNAKWIWSSDNDNDNVVYFRYTIVIGENSTTQPLSLNAATLPSGNVGEAYLYQLDTSGGLQPYQFSISSGFLPDGLSIDPQSGEINGTPVSAGDYNFTVMLTDDGNNVDTQDYSIQVQDNTGSAQSSVLNLTVTADNSNEVFVNGVLVGSGNNWQVAGVYQVALQQGENVIAIKGVDAGGVAALLAELSWDNNVAVSDSGWKVSTQEQAGWNNTGFNDSNWQNATSYGVYGVRPWKTKVTGFASGSSAEWIWSGDNDNDDVVYFRYIINN